MRTHLPARLTTPLLTLVLVLLPPGVPGVAGQQQPVVEPCRDRAEARQLDYWVGSWDVLHPETGDTLGINVIERILGGCALLENWTGAGGSSGKSLNFYDPQRKTWRQVWVSDRGNVLDYRSGEYRDGAMRFRGITLDAEGDTTHQKLRFERFAPDTVRQVFERSTDGAASWETTWVGVYVRRPSPPQ